MDNDKHKFCPLATKISANIRDLLLKHSLILHIFTGQRQLHNADVPLPSNTYLRQHLVQTTTLESFSRVFPNHTTHNSPIGNQSEFTQNA